MPRPNPPRKRPRRPAGNRIRADAQLNRQTAQSVQPQDGKPPARPSRQPGPAAKADVAVAPLPELWSRRSYAVLIVIVAVLQMILNAVQWAFSPAVSNGQSKGPIGIALDFINPISVLVASLIAPFIARPLTGERRALRPMESLVVGIIAYFFFTFISEGAFALAGSAGGTSTAPAATPCPASATCTASPTPGASASPTASPSRTGSGSVATTEVTTQDYVVLGGAVVLTYVITWWVYPPLYRRLRIKPRPRTPPSRNKGKDSSDAAKNQARSGEGTSGDGPAPAKHKRPWP